MATLERGLSSALLQDLYQKKQNLRHIANEVGSMATELGDMRTRMAAQESSLEQETAGCGNQSKDFGNGAWTSAEHLGGEEFSHCIYCFSCRARQGRHGSKQNEAWVEKCVAMASKVRAVLWKKKEPASYIKPELDALESDVQTQIRTEEDAVVQPIIQATIPEVEKHFSRRATTPFTGSSG